ncbi:hypothetical protein ACFL2Q_15010 [Thermodesulfobacteriota bacterium]
MPSRIPKPNKASPGEVPDVECSTSPPPLGAHRPQRSDDSRTSPPDEDSSYPPQRAEPDNDAGGLPLDPDELDTLKEMVGEYKARRMDFSCLPRRPRFKSPRVNSGFTCNDEIRERASVKAKIDPHGTGGSLSSLIELLLWKYIGCPSDVVENPSGSGDDP